MISITGQKKETILEHLPNIHVRRTVRQKSKRHRYYMEENRNALRLLKRLRSGIAEAW